MIPLLMLLAGTGCLGLYLVVKGRLEHVPPHVARTTRVVSERLEVGDENRLC